MTSPPPSPVDKGKLNATVADPDLQIREGGGGWGGHPHPEIRGGAVSVWSKNKRGTRALWAPPLDPPSGPPPPSLDPPLYHIDFGLSQ